MRVDADVGEGCMLKLGVPVRSTCGHLYPLHPAVPDPIMRCHVLGAGVMGRRDDLMAVGEVVPRSRWPAVGECRRGRVEGDMLCLRGWSASKQGCFSRVV